MFVLKWLYLMLIDWAHALARWKLLANFSLYVTQINQFFFFVIQWARLWTLLLKQSLKLLSYSFIDEFHSLKFLALYNNCVIHTTKQSVFCYVGWQPVLNKKKPHKPNLFQRPCISSLPFYINQYNLTCLETLLHQYH